MMQNSICIKLPFKQWQSSRSAFPTHGITYLFSQERYLKNFDFFPLWALLGDNVNKSQVI